MGGCEKGFSHQRQTASSRARLGKDFFDTLSVAAAGVEALETVEDG